MCLAHSKMNFEKLLDEQFLKKKTCLSVLSFVFPALFYTLINILSSYFYVSLSLLAVPSV